MTQPNSAQDQRPEVLFVCVHNAGRSQMAAALLSSLSGGRVIAMSAGTMPADHVHSEVAEAMRELGMEVGDATLELVTEEMLEGADRVVTMGCNVDDACPGAVFQSEDWGLPDPKGRPMDETRAIRETIRDRVLGLLEELGVPAQDQAGAPRGRAR